MEKTLLAAPCSRNRRDEECECNQEKPTSKAQAHACVTCDVRIKRQSWRVKLVQLLMPHFTVLVHMENGNPKYARRKMKAGDDDGGMVAEIIA